MSSGSLNILVFGVPLVILVVTYIARQKLKARKALRKLDEAKSSGLTEPATLHPLIDPSVCLGCGTCVTACPEGEILGLINRKAVLISPSSCIGHGACKEACPTDAISLVFGTATRGVEIPQLTPEFETTVPGIFIAGELGGMGLIKNAITQGVQAVASIQRFLRKTNSNSSGDLLDLIIVGAGPAGIAAALEAKQSKLNFRVFEQDSIGGTISHYPRGKIVMTQPAELPIVGKFQFKEASKETLMEFWLSAAAHVKQQITTQTRVQRIEQVGNHFVIGAGDQNIQSRTVLLALGRRGTPRKLGVKGEELSKVIYRLAEPEHFRSRQVLVVGGGDTALEAALAISEQPGAKVTLSYRSPVFSRAKVKNRDRIEQAAKAGHVNLLLNSQVSEITEEFVVVSTEAGSHSMPNDDVIVCAGGVLATPFLKEIGIHVEEKFGSV